MRFSNYNIVTKRLSNGDHVLLNSFMGTLDLIDEEAYEVLNAHSKDEELSLDVLESMGEVKDHFLERGYLTELGSREEVEEVRKYAKDIIESISDSRWSVVLVPNLGCNYRCTYCFEKGGGYPNQILTKKQVDSIFEIIKDKIGPGENITLYGGEPLAKENREIIEYIIKKGAEIDNTFFTVTNGHDLDHYMDLLGSDKLSTIQVTLDGPREIHNSRRIALDKESSYDRILANLERALKETDVEVKLRINLDKRNLPHMMEFFEDINSRGILDNPAVYVATCTVVGYEDVMVRHNEINELVKAIDKRFPQLKGNFTGFASSSNDLIYPALMYGNPIPRAAASCGACKNMRVFVPDGNIYSCWSSTSYPEQVIGTFDDKGKVSWKRDVLDAWEKKTLPYNNKCVKCKYALLCSGGCQRPKLPDEISPNEKECDYYNYLFTDYLARITDEYLAAGN